MDVLIVCPTGDRLFLPTLRGVLKQRSVGGRLDVFIPWQGVDHLPESHDRIAAKYEAARARCLDGGYDAMLCIEADMVVPPDALPRLAATEADVAYGLYVFRRPPWGWSAYSVIDGMVGWPLTTNPDRARADWGQVVEVDGVGLGCTLIRRHVLEAVPFRADGERHPNGTRSHCDWYAAQDWRAKGFRQVCDTGVRCGHIGELGRTGDVFPCVIWPDIDGQDLVRFDAFHEGVRACPSSG